MCVISRPIRNSDILKTYGGTKRNSLNTVLSSDEVDTDIDLSSKSPYVTIDQFPNYVKHHKNNLSFFTLNSQSISAKHDKIKVMLEHFSCDNDTDFSALCFQETWRKANESGEVDFSDISFNGYNPYAAGAKCSSHGGVVTYVKDNMQVEVKLKHGSNLWDGLFLLVQGEGIKPFILANIYRAPKPDNASIEGFLREFSPILETYAKDYKNIVICGDFNLDLLKISQREKFSDFLHLMLSYDFCPKITFPTRFAKYSASLLDLIFIRNSDISSHSSTKSGILYSSISDHHSCFCFLGNQTLKKTAPKYIEVEASDQHSINNFVESMSNSNLINKIAGDMFTDPNSTYKIIEDEINSLKAQHLPTKKVRFNKYKHKKSPWITYGILNSLKTRDNKLRKWKSSIPDSVRYNNLEAEYREYASLMDKLIRKAKYEYYLATFEKYKGDIKKTWKTINSIMNRNRKVNGFPSHIVTTKGKLSDKQEIANELNDYFCSVGHLFASKIPNSRMSYNSYLRKHITSTFSFSPVDVKTVKNIVRNSKPKTSKGTDGITMKLLKLILDSIALPLTILINQSMMTGIFPTQFKTAKIMPLLKKPNIYQIDNFRPISLLPCISKIVEKCVFNQLNEYFEKHKLLYNSQYGYRQGHSTETACLELIDKLHQQLENNQRPLCVFIDLSKAFDTLNHTILLSKLRYYGLDEHAISWFKSYLSNRKQFVQIDDIKSNVKNIETGVPQGSTLGPLLFIIYMNDISVSSDLLKSILFADDTTLNTVLSIFPASNGITTSYLINNELNKITEWLRANKLSLNTGKTKYMLFRYSQTPLVNIPKLNLIMDGKAIDKVDSFNFLGITISETLSWKLHIEKISMKMVKVIGVMRRIKNIVSSSILLKIYSSLILSHLHYGILCWGFSRNKLFRFQKKAIRLIAKQKYNAHTDPLFKKFKLLKIDDIFKMQSLKFLYKQKKGKTPRYFDNIFDNHQRNVTHNYNTRNRNMLHPVRTNRETTKNTIRYSTPLLFAELSENLKLQVTTLSLNSFKSSLKKAYLDSYQTQCVKLRCYVCSR